jgi:uncharacterized RDD family membrane protein YckC
MILMYSLVSLQFRSLVTLAKKFGKGRSFFEMLHQDFQGLGDLVFEVLSLHDKIQKSVLQHKF